MRGKGGVAGVLLGIVGVILAGCALFEEPEPVAPVQAPQVVASTGELSDGISISWSSVEGATDYHVFRAQAE